LLARRSSDRERLAELIRQAGSRPRRLGAERLMELGSLYRKVAADLAVLRRRFPGDPEIASHERLVVSAQSIVYARPRPGFGFLHFMTTRYWQRVASLRWHLLISGALMLVSGLVTFLWALNDPSTAARFFPISGMRTSYEDFGMSAGEQAAVSAEILTNNIRVSFLAFGLGITFGIGTLLVVLYNGMMLGSLCGLAVEAGNGETFFALVFPHGVLELSIIVVAAASGTRIGWAMLAPGNRTRTVALSSAGRHAVEVVLGTIPWFVLAGLIEGFLTPAGLGLGGATVVGILGGVAYWGLLAWRGRNAPPVGFE
jgi:uncharacterized membrane protein SpoIIM required for sporulation